MKARTTIDYCASELFNTTNYHNSQEKDPDNRSRLRRANENGVMNTFLLNAATPLVEHGREVVVLNSTNIKNI
jgi:hypothetical protein